MNKNMPRIEVHASKKALYGAVVDYKTNEVLRPATAGELKRTKDKIDSGDPDAYTGAWTDDDGRSVYVLTW